MVGGEKPDLQTSTTGCYDTNADDAITSADDIVIDEDFVTEPRGFSPRDAAGSG